MSAAPLAPPRDLTIPEAGSTTARAVLSRAIGRALRDLPLYARRAPELHALVARALKQAPGALASALLRPTVGTLVRCLRHEGLPNREAQVAELTALLALELGLAEALPAPVRLRRFPARWLSTTARAAIAVPAGATMVTVENGRLRVDHPGGAAELAFDALRRGDAIDGPIAVARPYTTIRGEILLAAADNNPLALEEAHPDKSGNAIDLGDRPASAWAEALGAALDTIGRYLPELRAEIDLYLHQIVPVGWDAEKHLSASYQEAIGTVYMSLHPSHMTLVEAIIHEFSHNKLNALFELDELLVNAWSPLYTSPVRPDPRPLHGVLLAVHAFQPVARLYERMIAEGDPLADNASFHGRYARIRQINREGAELILRVGQPTPVGKGLLDEMRRWDAHYAAVDSAAGGGSPRA